MKLILKFVGAALAIVAVPALAQKWVAVDWIDDFTDEEEKIVYWEDDRIRLQFSVEEYVPVGNLTDKSLFLYLKTKQMETFEPNSDFELRIDKNKMENYGPTMYTQFTPWVYRWSPRTIRVEVWHGDRQKGCKSILPFLTGETMIGRYYTGSTTRNTFKVPLDGLAEALDEVFGFGVCTSEEQAAIEAAVEEKWRFEREASRNCNGDLECAGKVTECSVSSADAEEMSACLDVK